MAATLAATRSGLYTALSALQTNVTTGPTTGRPFALVTHYSGEMTPDGLSLVCAQYPAALLRYDGAASRRTVSTVSGDSEEVAAETFSVFVALAEPRDIADAEVGASGAPGLDDLVDAVHGVCNALAITGLWRGRRVRHVSTQDAPGMIVRGSCYVRQLRYEALRALPQATTSQTSTPLTSVRGDVNLVAPSGEAAPDPFETFDADTTP